MSNTPDKIKLFVSYSHIDEPYFNVFRNGLKNVVANKNWSIWDDTKIHVGTFWDDEIQHNIKECNVALLLVSVGFMASKYVKENEYREFVKKYKDKGILIIPIVFQPCDFNNWEDIDKLQFFKPNGNNYGKSEIKDFTYADLIKFSETNNTLIPNPNIERYHLDLVKRVEESFKEFSKYSDTIPVKEVSIPAVKSENKLNQFPKPKTYFTGREQELGLFKKALDDKEPLIAIDGPGGIGKTQFVSKCIQEYVPSDKAIWFDCTQASQLDTLISEAGYPELLKGSSKTNRDKFSAFKDKIEENEYFLFLDNFQETNNNPVFKSFVQFIQDYLTKGKGCVIVIDRDNIADLNLNPKRIKIKGFEEKKLEYAQNLIKHRYNSLDISETDLERLCEQLKGYPLAIDFAILLISEGDKLSDIIAKIVEQDEDKDISERLLNAIFSRQDATPEEREFMKEFSVFNGTVPEFVVKSVISDSIFDIARKKLQKKNLLTYADGNYEIHPLVKEFCYKELDEKDKLHSKVAECYIFQRNEKILNPALEEQIFFHLSQSKQWKRIEKEIEERGKEFILQGQLGLVKELLEKLKELNLEKPIFNIFYGDIDEIQGRWDEAKIYYEVAKNQEKDKKIKAEGMIKYAEMQHRKGNVKEALKYYEEAYEFAKQNKFLKEEARAINDIGLVYDAFGDLNNAIDKYNEGLNIRVSIDDKDGIVTSLSNIASIHKTRGNLDEALKKYKESLKIAEEIGDKSGIAVNLRSLGIIYDTRCEYNKGLKNYEESLRIEKEIGNKSGIASSIINIGAIYAEKGELDEALKKYQDSLKIRQEIGAKSGIANSLNLIGNIYQLKGKLDDALNNFNEALKIYYSIGIKEGIAISISNIGRIYLERNRFDDCMKMYDDSLKIYLEIGDKHGIASLTGCIGLVLKKKQKFTEALVKYEESLKAFIEIGNKSECAAILNNIAALLHTQGNIDEAIRKYEECLKIKEDIGNTFGMSNVFHNMGVIFAEDLNKRFDLALVYLFKALSLNNKMGIKLNARENINWILKIRDKDIGLEKFKICSVQAYAKLDLDMQQYVPISDFLKYPVHIDQKQGRNDLCSCGSGKKYKNCHGQ